MDKSLTDIVLELDLAIANISVVLASLDPEDVIKLCRAMLLLQKGKKSLDESSKSLDALYSKMSQETIPNAFEANGIKQNEGLKLDGRSIKVATRINASIPAAKRAEGHKWLREKGYEGAITEGVNPKQLSGIVADYFEANSEMPPENAVTIYMQPYTAIHKG